MAMARVLISTFGFDEAKVLRALRTIGYDRLVLLADPESLRRPGFRRIEAVELAAGGAVEVVKVNAFDLASCFEHAVETIERLLRAGHAVRLNVSGGTKVLSAAALLAAFQTGVETWHCEETAQRIPVLRGVRFEDRLSPVEYDILGALRRAGPVSRIVDVLRKAGRPEGSVNAALASLQRQGFVSMEVRKGKAVAWISPGLAWFLRPLVYR